MDRNFHTDDFERLLREKSEEFRMYPSKRIWNSIYNNIHPGRKWPSIAMSITLVSALLMLGYFNTNNKNFYSGSGKNEPHQKIIEQKAFPQFFSRTIIDNPRLLNETIGKGNVAFNETDEPTGIQNNNFKKKLATKSSPIAITHIANRQQSIPKGIDSKIGNGNIIQPTKDVTFNHPVISEFNLLPGLTHAQIEMAGEYNTVSDNDQPLVLTYLQKTAINNFFETVSNNDFAIQYINRETNIIKSGNSSVEKNNLSSNKSDFISTEDKDWIENYALYNRPATKKWANKLSWQLYATPSIVYRLLYNDPNFGNTIIATPLAISTINQDINRVVIQKPSFGFEIGTGLQYSIFKGVKIKAGLQLNFTRYNSSAFQNTHPVSTRLTMHDFNSNTSYEISRTTPYSNKSGLEAVKLHNETFQISLPMGTDLKLIGNENLQWNLGLTMQPTFVAGGKSYLISSDNRNYVKETSMLNKWNLNAGFETFITFKANGLTWQIGPQFRTQLFSTNTKKLAIGEKLVNYGLKFGVSKTIK